jgi:hypothetical protein
VSEHLSTQGRPDPRGGLRCSWCPNQTSTSSLNASDALKIIKNRLKLRKLWPPKLKGVKNSKNKITEQQKASSQTLKNFLLCYSVAI